MAASEVAIANRALQKLGAKRISSLTQEIQNARTMNVAFIPIRDALLRQYQWNFCVKRASIAADVSEDAYEGLNRFLLPNDYARLLREKNTGLGIESRKDWQIEGAYILTTDSAPLQFRYLARVTDPALFDPLFDELFAAKLAFETVQDVSGSNTKKQDLRVDVDTALADARRANAFENDADDPPEDEWVATMRQNGFRGW